MDSAELAVMEFGRVAVISKEAQGMHTSILAGTPACADLPCLSSPPTSMQAYSIAA